MASGESEMDMELSLMYADVDDFGQDQEFNDSDLFDDMITSRSNDASDSKLGSHTARSGGYSGGYSGKRIALYVANLTWWTTDQDLTDAIAGVGVTDLIEIKFNENRANGQSKGFATVLVASENSCRLMMEKLPKRELHGQAPVVTYATRQALKQFDTQPRKDIQQQQQQPNNGPRIGPPPRGPPGLQQQQGPPPPSQFAHPGGFPPAGARLGPPPQPGSVSGPPPPGVPISGITILQAPRPYPSHSLPPPHTGPPILVQTQPGQPPMAMTMAPPRLAIGPPPPGMMQRGPQIVGIRGPPPGAMDPRGPPPTRAEWPRPPEQYQQPPPPVAGFQLHRPPPGGVLLTQHPPPVVAGGPVAVPPPHLHAMPPHSGPPPGHPQAPVPHVNPAFFPSASTPSNVPSVHQPAVQVSHHTDPYGRPVVSYTPGDAYAQHRAAQATAERSSAQYPSADNYGRRTSPERVQPGGYPGGDAYRDRRPPSPRIDRHESSASQLSESEFDEILQRNKTVSSTAISRAVQDASAGEFASAIETLVTAISLIKQSKIASDDRCKILISSLQDTLHGIESKSYGSKLTTRDRRSRSRDREREKQSRHRSRSREREREYRDRSREKERHYETERHREKPERSERERSERERERSDRERSDRERSDREREYRESRSSRH